MDRVRCFVWFFGYFCVFATVAWGQAPGTGEPCQPDKLTVYKVVMHTFWSRETFPKHYPDWRPTAQFSKVFGRSHDKHFTLFRLGQKSSAGVKAFAESGKSDILEEQSQGEGGVYDEFTAPPVTSGVGRTETEFFVDGNHSKVSLMSRIVPSPDWFIGVDGFDLCVNGNWLDSITIEVDPIDAGTDNGFTFTAPNWPTEPQGEAYRITAHYPAHPAGSFFYPYLKRLPPIATFQFIKDSVKSDPYEFEDGPNEPFSGGSSDEVRYSDLTSSYSNSDLSPGYLEVSKEKLLLKDDIDRQPTSGAVTDKAVSEESILDETNNSSNYKLSDTTDGELPFERVRINNFLYKREVLDVSLATAYVLLDGDVSFDIEI